jgi:hypothetical protein
MDARALNDELLDQFILAGSDKASPEQLRVLAEHHWVKIRIRVAENPMTPRDVLCNLSLDNEYSVRIAIAKNPEFIREVSQSFESSEEHVRLDMEVTKIFGTIHKFFHNC